MTVWIAHPVTLDLSTAKEFGEFRFINQRYIYADEIIDGMLPLGFRTNIAMATRNFDPNNDYLMLAGDHLQLAYIVRQLTNWAGEFRSLRHDRQANGYVCAVIGDDRWSH